MEEDAEAFMFVVRELVFLDADNPVDLGELGSIPVQGRDVDSREFDREVLVGGLRLCFLVLWCVVLLVCRCPSWPWKDRKRRLGVSICVHGHS